MLSTTKRARRAVTEANRAARRAMLEGSPGWAKSAFGPLALHLDMLFVDHGIFRAAYLNRHQLDAHAMRSAQPTPGQIRRLAAGGLKTIVNLRGERECGSFWLEEQACREAGIELVSYRVRSRAAPTPAEVLGARDLFNELEYPILMHCKSGADRAGLMSVLYLFLHRGVPLETAVKQLSLRYGHIRQAETGVLDYFFERYMAANREKPIAFIDWLTTVYDPDEVKVSFRSNGIADRLVNGILRRE